MSQTIDHTTPPAPSELTVFLAERDMPCPACGYNLRGLTTGTCPECREMLQIRVGVVEPKLGALLIGLTGLLAGAGLGIAVLGLLLYLAMRLGGGPTWREVGTFVVATVLGVALTTALAVRLASRPGRVWFRRRSPAGRTWLAVGCWGLTAGLIALVIEVAE